MVRTETDPPLFCHGGRVLDLVDGVVGRQTAPLLRQEQVSSFPVHTTEKGKFIFMLEPRYNFAS